MVGAKALLLILALAMMPDTGGNQNAASATADDDFEVGLYTLFLPCSDPSGFVVYPSWCGDYLEVRERMPAPSGSD